MFDAKMIFVGADPAMRRLMEQILRAEGAQVTALERCDAALRLCQRELPDLVILTVGPGGEEVFEACRQLRRRSHVPIIILSTVDHSEHVITALACGADDFILLPFDLAVLRARIRAVLRRCGRPLDGPGAAHYQTGLPDGEFIANV